MKARKTALLASIAVLLGIYIIQLVLAGRSSVKTLTLKTEPDTYTIAASDGTTVLKKTPDGWTVGDKDYAAIAEGYVNVPADGIYYFLSDNGEVWVDDELVVDNRALRVRHSLHGGGSKALSAGLHKFKVFFSRYTADGFPTEWADINVSMTTERGGFVAIDPKQLFH